MSSMARSRGVVIWYLVGLSCSFWLSGCSQQGRAPLTWASTRQPRSDGVHIVKDGETLTGIAERYGHDFHYLASINSISGPRYYVQPGQRIYFAKRGHASPLGISNETSVATTGPANHGFQWSETELEAEPAGSARPVSTPAAPPGEASIASNVDPDGPVPYPVKERTVKKSAVRFACKWPAKGKLLRAFDGKTKGIDIAGKIGQPVKACADGWVDYSGNSLKGYGNLIILRHDGDFLSVYAHNQSLLVKEGDAVKQGQAIAEMGQTGTDRVQLHFELRHHGKPVDPELYLK